ncbi:MAG: DUF3347 domain-containing protein [Daejeonella sp.]
MNYIKSIIIAGSVSFFLGSCAQVNSNRENEKVSIDSTSQTDKTVLKDDKVNDIYSNYLILKNALVQSNSADAIKAGNALETSLKNIEGCQSTAEIAAHLAASNDIKVQREDFTRISSDIIAYMKNADVASGTMYVQYCPMANKGEGGYWLASEKKIQNPYYGDEMMECGEVKEEITKK